MVPYGIVDASVRSSAAIVQLSGIIAVGQVDSAMVRVRAMATATGSNHPRPWILAATKTPFPV